MLRVIGAGAGTGKTSRLVTELHHHLLGENGRAQVEPERVLAVTFTRGAAAELEERVRRGLLAERHTELARRLGAARIGTVHAVCQRLVEDFAFELGLAPSVRALDESLAARALEQALASAVTDGEIDELEELSTRVASLQHGNWTKLVGDLIESARAASLDAEGLQVACARSEARLRALLPPPRPAAQLEEELVGELSRFVGRATGAVDTLHARAVRDATEAIETLQQGTPLRWALWAAVDKQARKSSPQHIYHPLLHEDLLRAHNLVYALATRALSHYADGKREAGVVDFSDMEGHALTLLQRADLKDRLRDEIHLVLVDEFQDTSPVQLLIFKALLDVARSSVWVGDPKQSIYAFRGADPDVVRATLEKLAPGPAEQLQINHRSRPDLVKLVSGVFMSLFQRHGFAPAEVALEPEANDDDPALGPCMEWWPFPERETEPTADAHKNREDDEAGVLATGVQQVLADPRVRVRTRRGDRDLRAAGTPRPPRPSDIAVLVRTNDAARRVARALLERGVPAVLRRTGLSRTPEVRALLAGLRLVVDGGDLLAAVEVIRILVHPTDPGATMVLLVGEADGQKARALDHPLVLALRALGAEARTLGVAPLIDRVIDILALRAWCARAPDPAQRLANLGALRALALKTGAAQNAQGRGATLPGFLAHVEALGTEQAQRRPDDDDRLGTVEGLDAVVVITWHKSKGLEWPIVVVADLDRTPSPSVFGVHIETDIETGARWPRAWPTPYWRNQSYKGLGKLFEKTPEHLHIVAAQQKEDVRLLYVCLTRARDRLIFCGQGGPKNSFEGFNRAFHPLGVVEPTTLVRWAGLELPCVLRRLDGVQPSVRAAAVDTVELPAPPEPRAYPPAFVPPSSLEGRGSLVSHVRLGDPLPLRTRADTDEMTRLGQALHAFYAADPLVARPAANVELGDQRFRLAESLLQRWDVRHLMLPDHVVLSADRLWSHLNVTFGSFKVRREVPVMHRTLMGTIIRGQIDLLLVGDGAAVVIDHKTYPGGYADALEVAQTFGGQLRAYGEGVAAAFAQPFPATWIHLPLAAALVEVSTDAVNAQQAPQDATARGA